MKDYVFDEILHGVKLPLGSLLNDGSTYRITSSDFTYIQTSHREELDGFEKFLVITDRKGRVAGGVLFYGNTDIQITIFPEYRSQHLMSAIFKNGVLRSECYPDQKVTLDKKRIKSFDDFLMKHYLVSCAGLQIENLVEIHSYFNNFLQCDKLSGFQKRSLDEFVKTFS